MAKKTIALIVGHGGRDPGSISYTGVKEWDYNYRIANWVQKDLSQYNVEVNVMTKNRSNYTPIINKFKNNKVDLAIELHVNSAPPNVKSNGMEAIIIPESPQSSYLMARRTVTLLSQRLGIAVRNTGTGGVLVNPTRGIYNLQQINKMSKSGFILEPGFWHREDSDAKILLLHGGRKYATSLAAVIAIVMDLELLNKTEAKSTTHSQIKKPKVIKKQKPLPPKVPILTNLPGKTRIGAIELVVPPLSIRIDKMKRNHQVQTLRTRSSMKIPTGKAFYNITMDLFFPSLDDINGQEGNFDIVEDLSGVSIKTTNRPLIQNGLRAIIAQFRRIPFVELDNEYVKTIVRDNILKNTLMPNKIVVALENMTVSTIPGFNECLKATLSMRIVEVTNFVSDIQYHPSMSTVANEAAWNKIRKLPPRAQRDEEKRFKEIFKKKNVTWRSEQDSPNIPKVDNPAGSTPYMLYINGIIARDNSSSYSNNTPFDYMTSYGPEAQGYRQDYLLKKYEANVNYQDNFKIKIYAYNIKKEVLRQWIGIFNQVERSLILEKGIGFDLEYFLSEKAKTETMIKQLTNSNKPSSYASTLRNFITSFEKIIQEYAKEAPPKSSAETVKIVSNRQSKKMKNLKRTVNELREILRKNEQMNDRITIVNPETGTEEPILDLSDNKYNLPDILYTKITQITAGLSNILVTIPMQGRILPTAQHLGQGDTQYSVTFETNSKQFISMINSIDNWRDFKLLINRTNFINSFLQIDSPLFKLMGAQYVQIENINIQTVPNTGFGSLKGFKDQLTECANIVTVTFSEFDIFQYQREDIQPENFIPFTAAAKIWDDYKYETYSYFKEHNLDDSFFNGVFGGAGDIDWEGTYHKLDYYFINSNNPKVTHIPTDIREGLYHNIRTLQLFTLKWFKNKLKSEAGIIDPLNQDICIMSLPYLYSKRHISIIDDNIDIKDIVKKCNSVILRNKDTVKIPNPYNSYIKIGVEESRDEYDDDYFTEAGNIITNTFPIYAVGSKLIEKNVDGLGIVYTRFIMRLLEGHPRREVWRKIIKEEISKNQDKVYFGNYPDLDLPVLKGIGIVNPGFYIPDLREENGVVHDNYMMNSKRKVDSFLDTMDEHRVMYSNYMKDLSSTSKKLFTRYVNILGNKVRSKHIEDNLKKYKDGKNSKEIYKEIIKDYTKQSMDQLIEKADNAKFLHALFGTKADANVVKYVLKKLSDAIIKYIDERGDTDVPLTSDEIADIIDKYGGLITNNFIGTWGKESAGFLKADIKYGLQHYKDKNNKYTLNRAFPTFKIYFVEKDDAGLFNGYLYRKFDDFYSYSSVISIDFVASRKNPTDVCIIKMTNLGGRLSDMRALDMKENLNADQTEDEQMLYSLFLQAGTAIQLRLGYESDPEDLDIIFNGKITDVNYGDIVEIVCQSHATDLLDPIKLVGEEKDFDSEKEAHINWIMEYLCEKSLSEWFGRDQMSFSTAYLKSLFETFTDPPLIRLPHPKDFIYRYGQWIDISGAPPAGRKLFTKKTQNINVTSPEPNKAYETAKRRWYKDDKNYKIYSDITYSIMNDLIKFYPGQFIRALPYDDRMTLFMGKASTWLKYTDRWAIESADWIKTYADKMVTPAGTDITQGFPSTMSPKQMMKAVLRNYVTTYNEGMSVDDGGWITFPGNVQRRVKTESVSEEHARNKKWWAWMWEFLTNGSSNIGGGENIMEFVSGFRPVRRRYKISDGEESAWIPTYVTERVGASTEGTAITDLDGDYVLDWLQAEIDQLEKDGTAGGGKSTDTAKIWTLLSWGEADSVKKAAYSLVAMFKGFGNVIPYRIPLTRFGTIIKESFGIRQEKVAKAYRVTWQQIADAIYRTQSWLASFLTWGMDESAYPDYYEFPDLPFPSGTLFYWDEIPDLFMRLILYGKNEKIAEGIRQQYDKNYNPSMNNVTRKGSDPHPQFRKMRQHHVITSLSDICINNMTTNDRGVYNKIICNYSKSVDIDPTNPGAYDQTPIEMKFDDSQPDAFERTKMVRTYNAEEPGYAKRYAQSFLAESIMDGYSGEITILGNPKIMPWDKVTLMDTYTGIMGSIQVEEVIHHFSRETGFLTTIVPDMIVECNNIVSIQEDDILDSCLFYNSMRFVSNISVVTGTILAFTPLAPIGGALILAGTAGEIIANSQESDKREDLQELQSSRRVTERENTLQSQSDIMKAGRRDDELTNKERKEIEDFKQQQRNMMETDSDNLNSSAVEALDRFIVNWCETAPTAVGLAVTADKFILKTNYIQSLMDSFKNMWVQKIMGSWSVKTTTTLLWNVVEKLKGFLNPILFKVKTGQILLTDTLRQALDTLGRQYHLLKMNPRQVAFLDKLLDIKVSTFNFLSGLVTKISSVKWIKNIIELIDATVIKTAVGIAKLKGVQAAGTWISKGAGKIPGGLLTGIKSLTKIKGLGTIGKWGLKRLPIVGGLVALYGAYDTFKDRLTLSAHNLERHPCNVQPVMKEIMYKDTQLVSMIPGALRGAFRDDAIHKSEQDVISKITNMFDMTGRIPGNMKWLYSNMNAGFAKG